MGFTIKYATLLTLRCWYAPALVGVSSSVPLPALPGSPTTAQRKEMRAYLRYDLRSVVHLRPTSDGRALLDRTGARWLPTTQGGVVVAGDKFTLFTEPIVVGCYLRDPAFFDEVAVYVQDKADAVGAAAGTGSALKSKVFAYANAAGNPLEGGEVNGLKKEHFVDRPPGEDGALIGLFSLYLKSPAPKLDVYFNPKN